MRFHLPILLLFLSGIISACQADRDELLRLEVLEGPQSRQSRSDSGLPALQLELETNISDAGQINYFLRIGLENSFINSSDRIDSQLGDRFRLNIGEEVFEMQLFDSSNEYRALSRNLSIEEFFSLFESTLRFEGIGSSSSLVSSSVSLPMALGSSGDFSSIDDRQYTNCQIRPVRWNGSSSSDIEILFSETSSGIETNTFSAEDTGVWSEAFVPDESESVFETFFTESERNSGFAEAEVNLEIERIDSDQVLELANSLNFQVAVDIFVIQRMDILLLFLDPC